MARRLPLNGHPEGTRPPIHGDGSSRGLRLIELGLRCPPETFLQLKLTRLAGEFTLERQTQQWMELSERVNSVA